MSPDPATGHADHAWSNEINGLRARASAALQRIERETGAHVRDLRDGAARALDQTRDIAAERATVLADFAAGMKKAFAHGLDDLAEAARARVIAARQKAYAAGLRTETQAREATRKAGRMIEDHPMIAGAVAFALGAALAASLPRTRVEDRTLGAERDRLLDQAAKALQTEIARAGRVAKGVADELATSASAAVSAVSDGVSETLETVKDRARTEAAKSKS